MVWKSTSCLNSPSTINLTSSLMSSFPCREEIRRIFRKEILTLWSPPFLRPLETNNLLAKIFNNPQKSSLHDHSPQLLTTTFNKHRINRRWLSYTYSSILWLPPLKDIDIINRRVLRMTLKVLRRKDLNAAIRRKLVHHNSSFQKKRVC